MIYRDINIGAPGTSAAVVTTTGDAATVTGDDSVGMWAARCVVANPGSLVHRPQFGAGLERFIAAPIPVASQQARSSIRRAVMRHDDVVAVSVKATPRADVPGGTLSLDIDVATSTGDVRQVQAEF